MNSWIILILFLICIIFIVLFFKLTKKNKKKVGMDNTDKPAEDIYPLY
jgi:hypothetical protein